MEAQYDSRFLKGVDEFNRGLFFECHETLEEIWLEENGENRLFYQGVIQIAAGYFKWEQGVSRGAIKLWRAGLEKLESYGPVHLGIHLDTFTRGVQSNLQEVEAASEDQRRLSEINIPVLSHAP